MFYIILLLDNFIFDLILPLFRFKKNEFLEINEMNAFCNEVCTIKILIIREKNNSNN